MFCNIYRTDRKFASAALEFCRASALAGSRRYTHRWKYDPRYARVFGESWPNGVGRGFVYSSIGALEIETGLGTGLPSVLRVVESINALGGVISERLGDSATGGFLRVQRSQTLATGQASSPDATFRARRAGRPFQSFGRVSRPRLPRGFSRRAHAPMARSRSRRLVPRRGELSRTKKPANWRASSVVAMGGLEPPTPAL